LAPCSALQRLKPSKAPYQLDAPLARAVVVDVRLGVVGQGRLGVAERRRLLAGDRRIRRRGLDQNHHHDCQQQQADRHGRRIHHSLRNQTNIIQAQNMNGFFTLGTSFHTNLNLARKHPKFLL